MKKPFLIAWALCVFFLIGSIVNYYVAKNDSYISHFNAGNEYLRNGEYNYAVSEYDIALTKNPTAKKDCSIRINEAIAVCKTYDEENNTAEENKKIIDSACYILTSEGCADVDGQSGHNADAQNLYNEIKQVPPPEDSEESEDNQKEENQNNSDNNEGQDDEESQDDKENQGDPQNPDENDEENDGENDGEDQEKEEDSLGEDEAEETEEERQQREEEELEQNIREQLEQYQREALEEELNSVESEYYYNWNFNDEPTW